ncbi:hypothetical protein AK830_g5970 [Neonectria ditissima]|uniref:DUF7726 domain-containing protein n=1 Tax=Neonectria ditissima TaxID=78410 RepID=A0A0P7B3L6_9HYPO|nr:hypothetical protein AK830_g5970 [Neonectria ditissima]
MSSSGWSWSPTRALATFNPNVVNSLPSLEGLGLPNPVGYGGLGAHPAAAPRPPPPPSGPTNENAAPAASGSASTAKPAPDPERAAAAAAAAKPATAATSRKRKSDVAVEAANEDLFPENVEAIDDDDPRLDRLDSDTCNAVRRKIRTWIDSGAMKVGQFQDALGVSSKAYGSFMNRTGTWDGEGCDTFHRALVFFKKRELQGLPLKAAKPKKPKTAESSKKAADLLDVAGVELPRESSNSVPVFDTCDEVRKKIRALLAKDGVTQAAFVREISKTFTDGRKVSPANLRYFMGRRGVIDGNTNVTYYAAYVFFEKQRIKAGKPKTKFREEMEKVHKGTGVDTENSASGGVFTLADETVTLDKYGRMLFHKTR